MQKILNDPRAVRRRDARRHPRGARRTSCGAPAPRAIVRADAPIEGKVGIATGGGSGHLPRLHGLCRRRAARRRGDRQRVRLAQRRRHARRHPRRSSAGAGVLYLYGNYGGDVMNFDLAAELAADEGIEVRDRARRRRRRLRAAGRASSRRGIAGHLLPVQGRRAPAAAEGASLDEVVAVTERAAADLRTMGVALSPCTIPAAGVPTFELPVGQMEIGMGIHGEPGVRRGPLETADEIADELTARDPRRPAVPPRRRGGGAGQRPRARRRRRSCTSSTGGVAADPRRERGIARPPASGSASTPRRWRWPARRCRCCGWTTSCGGLVDAPADTPFFVQA